PASDAEIVPGPCAVAAAECGCKCSCRAESARPSQSIPLLGRCVASAIRKHIVRQIGENFECPRQPLSLLAQHDLVTSPKNFHLAGAKPKFLRQPDSLTVA